VALTLNRWVQIDANGIADMSIMPWLRAPERQGVNIDDYPNVKKWRDKIAGRPAVKKALEVLADPKGQVERQSKKYGLVYRSHLFGETSLVLLSSTWGPSSLLGRRPELPAVLLAALAGTAAEAAHIRMHLDRLMKPAPLPGAQIGASRAEVSKRTFFRFFAAKEEAILAPETELFEAMLEALREHPLRGPLIDDLRDAALQALDGRGPEWHAQFATALGIVEASAPVKAAALRQCSLTTDRAAEALGERTAADSREDPMTRLTVDVFVTAWRSASERWSRDGAPDPAALRRLVSESCARIARVPDYTLAAEKPR
jgi:AcrR family transcriptional regulator